MYVFLLAPVVFKHPLANTTLVTELDRNSVILMCNVTGYPKPSITWIPFAGDRMLIEEFTNSNSTNGLRIVSSSLKIPSFNSEDAGNYTCTASNAINSISRVFLLSLKGEF